jgi:F0F1-type ATP synthase membrane subunit b/b'
MSERSGHIEKKKADIENIGLEIETLKEKFVSLTATTRKKAGEERSEIRNSGLVEAEKFLSESRKKVSSIRAKADEEVEGEFNRARPLLRGEAISLAEEIVESVIGRRIAVDS